MNQKKICIIGAGIGGLTAGVLLTKKGYSVHIFEKEPMIGGRALSFTDFTELNLQEYLRILGHYYMHIPFSSPDLATIFEKKMLNGYKLDLGYHAIGGGVLSNLNDLLSEINEHVDIFESSVGLIRKDGYDYPFLSTIDRIRIAPKILRMLFASEKTLKKLDPIPMTETIKKYGKGKMKHILEVFSRTITTMNNLDLISTGEMFRSQRNLYKGSKPVGYPKDGLHNVHDKLARFIKNNGGGIHLKSPVEKIIVEDGKAIGVKVKGKEIGYDAVLSSVLVQDLFKITDEKEFPKDYVEYLKSLKGTGSLCAYYSLKKLDEDLIGKTFHFLERDVGVNGNDVVGMIDFMASDPTSGLAPKAEYLVQSYVICTPKEAKNKEILKKLKGLLDKNLKYLIPDYEKHLNWSIYPAIWHLDGVAKTIENDKPDIKTPVENLYLVGDCVKATGIGFNCALNSAKQIVNFL